MQITHAISHLTSTQRDFHADPLNGSTPLNMSYGTCAFSLPIMLKLGTKSTEFASLDVKLHCTPRQHIKFPRQQRISILIVLPTPEFRLCICDFFTCAYEKHRRRKIKGEHSHSHQCRSHHRLEATLIGVLAVLKTAVSMTVLPSTLLILSIHSTSGGRTGNSVLTIVKTGRFLSSPQDSLKALAFQNLVFLTNVTTVQEVRGGCEDWMELVQDRDRWRAIVSTVMNLRVPKMRGIS